MEPQNRPINPLHLAWKLRDVRNFELPEIQKQLESNPRLLELLWFIAWASEPKNYPGGLVKFTTDFIEANWEKIGPAAVLEIGFPDKYTPTQAAAILPSVGDFSFAGQSECWKIAQKNARYAGIDVADWEPAPIAETAKIFAAVVDPRQFRQDLKQKAIETLPTYLRSLCELKHVEFLGTTRRFSSKDSMGYFSETHDAGAPWYWPLVCEDLLDWMDHRAGAVMSKIADTKVSRSVLKWVRRSRECGMPVWLTGSCRFGKTESIRAISNSQPGLYRIVETPDDTSILSLCKAVAEALGIDCTGDTALTLRGKIGEVLEASGIQLIFDESHFLLPTKVTKNTRPQRLDFVRRTIIDRGLPAVFVSTPQSYSEARRKFEKATGYTMGQWDGRLLREEPVELPETINETELLAVAAVHLPNFDTSYLKVIIARVSAVRGSSVYAQIAKVCKMAFSIAGENGRKRPILADIVEASQEVLPSFPGAADDEPTAPKRTPTLRPALPTRPGKRGNLVAVGTPSDLSAVTA